MLERIWACIRPFNILFSFLLNRYPEVELLGGMEVLFLILWVLFSILFFIMTKPIYFPRKRAQLPEAVLQGKVWGNRRLQSPPEASQRSNWSQGCAMKRHIQASAALDLGRHPAGVPATHTRSLHDGNILAAQPCAVHYAFWLPVSCFCSPTSPGPSPP